MLKAIDLQRMQRLDERAIAVPSADSLIYGVFRAVLLDVRRDSIIFWSWVGSHAERQRPGAGRPVPPVHAAARGEGS